MSSTPTRNISLTSELESFIRTQVATGLYSNASEVVRAGLRLLIKSQPPIDQTVVAQAVRRGTRAHGQ